MVNLIVKCSNDRAERSATYVTEQLIEGLMSTIKASKKPLPVWAIDMAMRAYETWKIYQNGQKVEKVQRVVLSVLEHVAEIKDQVETGRAMSEREYRLTREAQPDKWAHTHARGVHCGRPPALNDYQREEAARRLAEGESVRSVARLLGVSHVTVAKLRFA